MGTIVGPIGSSITTARRGGGGGNMGAAGMMSGMSNRYNSIGDSGGIMGDSSDPTTAAKAEMTEEERKKLGKTIDDIKKEDIPLSEIRAKVSKALTDAGVPHDPNTLNTGLGFADGFGLLNNRINITTEAVTKASSGGGAATADAGAAAVGGAQEADAAVSMEDINGAITEDLTAASTDLLDGDSDLTGSTTVADTIDPANPAGLTVGDIVTDDRITGDLEFIYDADSNLFHYVPFDVNGNRVYTGETLAASDVVGFDSTGVKTGQSIGVYTDTVRLQVRWY